MDDSAFDCVECKVNTLRAPKGIGEYYMVKHFVWALTNGGKGMLCIGCVEKQIGRELTPNDFLDCPLNKDMDGRSERLLQRRGQLG